jgi:hypothetical protein
VWLQVAHTRGCLSETRQLISICGCLNRPFSPSSKTVYSITHRPWINKLKASQTTPLVPRLSPHSPRSSQSACYSTQSGSTPALSPNTSLMLQTGHAQWPWFVLPYPRSVDLIHLTEPGLGNDKLRALRSSSPLRPRQTQHLRLPSIVPQYLPMPLRRHPHWPMVLHFLPCLHSCSSAGLCPIKSLEDRPMAPDRITIH